MATTTTSKSEPKSEPTTTRRPAGLIRYKSLPSGWKEADHYWYYGWVITGECEPFRRYISKTGRPFPRHEVAIVPTAISYMRHDLGFHNINYVLGKPDAESTAKGLVTQAEDGPMVELAVISCTRSKLLYMYRPKLEQMQLLIKIFGEEPRWFEDFYIKKESIDETVY